MLDMPMFTAGGTPAHTPPAQTETQTTPNDNIHTNPRGDTQITQKSVCAAGRRGPYLELGQACLLALVQQLEVRQFFALELAGRHGAAPAPRVRARVRHPGVFGFALRGCKLERTAASSGACACRAGTHAREGAS